MGYAHGTEWTESKVLDAIKEAMEGIGIDRMPSRSEMDKYYGNSALSNKISKTGGFYHYAEMLGMEIKPSETALGVSVENTIRHKLISLGFDVEKTPTKFPYDLIVNKRVKIDVKAGRLTTSGIWPYYTFNLEKKEPTCDFYVAVTLKEADEVKDIYIIPSSVLAGKSQLSIGVRKSIYNKYIDRWDLIELIDQAFSKIETS